MVMNKYYKINENLYYVMTAYKDIYTTVYLIRTEEGYLLFDCASFDCDADNAIAPMLEGVGVKPEELKLVFISHAHTDHIGGLKRFLELYPNTAVVTKNSTLHEKYPGSSFIRAEEGELLLGNLKVVYIPGHSACSQAILDTRDGTLITGDCLQLYGIYGSGNWAANISLPREHFAALDKLWEMDINAIYTAHDYHPLGQFYEGREKVQAAISACREPLLSIMQMIKDNPDLTDEEIAAMYNAPKTLPKLGAHVVRNLRAVL